MGYDNAGPAGWPTYQITTVDQNLEELARGLAQQKLPYECTTGFLSTYVYGAPEACLGEAKRGTFIDQKLSFLDYLASLAAEPHFRQRVQP